MPRTRAVAAPGGGSNLREGVEGAVPLVWSAPRPANSQGWFLCQVLGAPALAYQWVFTAEFLLAYCGLSACQVHRSGALCVPHCRAAIPTIQHFINFPNPTHQSGTPSSPQPLAHTPPLHFVSVNLTPLGTHVRGITRCYPFVIADSLPTMPSRLIHGMSCRYFLPFLG